MSKLAKMVNYRFEEYFRKLFVGHADAYPQFYQDYAPEMLIHFEIIFKSFRAGYPKSYLIAGPKGTGKTSALAIIARQYLSAQAEIIFDKIGDDDFGIASDGDIVHTDKNGIRRVLNPMTWIDIGYLTHRQLVNILRDNAGADFVGPYVLFLDDLGRRGFEDQAGWNLSLQEDFFDNRWKKRMPTYITTNEEPIKIRTWPGWEGIADRLLDKSRIQVIGLLGESRRK